MQAARHYSMGLGLVTCLADARRLGTPLDSSQVTNRYPVASDPSPGSRQRRNKVASNPASRVIRPLIPPCPHWKAMARPSQTMASTLDRNNRGIDQAKSLNRPSPISLTFMTIGRFRARETIGKDVGLRSALHSQLPKTEVYVWPVH